MIPLAIIAEAAHNSEPGNGELSTHALDWIWGGEYSAGNQVALVDQLTGIRVAEARGKQLESYVLEYLNNLHGYRSSLGSLAVDDPTQIANDLKGVHWGLALIYGIMVYHSDAMCATLGLTGEDVLAFGRIRVILATKLQRPPVADDFSKLFKGLQNGTRR